MAEDMRVVELFAGVGGFRVGLERASDRFNTVWANQWEPGKKNQFAFDCYNRHFGNTGSVNVNEDIETVKDDVPEHDLLVGGFPCQDYSVASTNARGIEGKKGVLWWSIHDIVRSRRPRYILLENVDRLTRSPVNQRGRDFGIILRCLADLGYTVEWRVINAAEYGLQQRRRRTFIFACRDDTSFHDVYSGEPEDIITRTGFFAQDFPVSGEVVKGKVGTVDISPERFADLVDFSENFAADFHKSGFMRDHAVYTRDVEPLSPDHSTTLGELLQTDVDEKYFDVDIEKWRYMKGAKRIERTRKDGSTQVFSEGAIPFPDILDRPGRTMLTSEGSVNRSSHLVQDPTNGRFRILTPVECERLNGFDDDWTEGMSERQRYFTMGNALVVQLVEIMGRRLASVDLDSQ